MKDAVTKTFKRSVMCPSGSIELNFTMVSSINCNSAVIPRSSAQSKPVPEANLVFMTMPRPTWDFHREYDDNKLDAMPREDREKLQAAINADFTTYFKKTPEDFPDWGWIVSTSAYRLSQHLIKEIQRRDQDELGLYISNDFTGYGTQEVIENLVDCPQAEWIHIVSSNCYQLILFTTEFRKSKSSTLLLWVLIEALAHACCDMESNLVAWNSMYSSQAPMHSIFLNAAVIDDGDRLRQTLEQIGLALLSTLNRLERDGLWDIIPNLSLVLSMYFAWAPMFKDAMYDQTWLAEVAAYAEKHAMEIRGAYSIEAVLDKHSTKNLDNDCVRQIRRPPSDDKHNFEQQVGLSGFVSFCGRNKMLTRSVVETVPGLVW